MFPLHQGNELCFQISFNPHQQHKISDDLIIAHAVLHGNDMTDNKGKNRRRKLFSVENDESTNDSDRNIKKKMAHRDTERQRRQEMATLYASIRSLLPLEFIKGKRSISDHMNEAVNYIKHLQKKIKELGAKRDELKKLSNLSDTSSQSESLCNYTPSSIIVRPCLGGIEVVLNSGLSERDLSLSRVLGVLLEEGISVVNCVSTKTNERLFHTIQTEVNDPSCSVLSGLQQKLVPLIPSLSDI